jgi:hypothetical protein
MACSGKALVVFFLVVQPIVCNLIVKLKKKLTIK